MDGQGWGGWPGEQLVETARSYLAILFGSQDLRLAHHFFPQDLNIVIPF